MPSEHRNADYRRKLLPLALVRRVLGGQQQRIYRTYTRFFPPNPQLRILDLGVTPTLERREQHFFETNYPYPDRITAAGIEEAGRFPALFPTTRYVRVERSQPLPFEDDEFDVVFCSAVIEHVGSRQAQRAFLKEIMRVGRAAFLTTPNRWYPVELHTMMPLVHYLPARTYRAIYQRAGFGFFAQEQNLNLLDGRAIRTLLDPSWRTTIARHYFLGMPSNFFIVLAR